MSEKWLSEGKEDCEIFYRYTGKAFHGWINIKNAAKPLEELSLYGFCSDENTSEESMRNSVFVHSYHIWDNKIDATTNKRRLLCLTIDLILERKEGLPEFVITQLEVVKSTVFDMGIPSYPV